MKRWSTTRLRPILLAILIGVMPPALAGAAEATPPAGQAVEVQAATAVTAEHGATGVEAAAQHDAGEHHAANSLSSEKLWDLLWRTLNFLALLFLLVKFGAKPVLSGLSGRQQRIREELETLTRRRDEAEQAYREFEGRLAGLEKEADILVERAVAQARVEKERILADAVKAAEDIRRQAEAAVQAEVEEAKRMLREEVAEQAAAMAEELIVQNLTPADQVAITEQYLERVGAVQ
ncbi:MAG: ATP synthase F0 subunit B [Desulfobulbus sp.]|jgi:F-type H+-transporting ATPase subunit b